MPRVRAASRRSSRRRVWLPSCFGTSSDDMDFNIQLGIQLALTMTPRKRTTKKQNENNKKTRPSPQTKPRNPNASVISVDDSDDECIAFVKSKSDDIKKSVVSKVDTFFKSSGLISDDEDEPVVVSTSNSNKGFNEPCCSTSKDANDPTNTDKVIVIEDDANQITSLADIENYCKETEDLLKNANALLEKFAGTSKEKEQPEQIQNNRQNESNKPERGLGECPVCYENLSEKQVMSTKCGHLFCKECIKKVATSIKKCPSCRKAVNMKNIIPIYI